MSSPANPEQLLAESAWLTRLSRELVPADAAADLAQDTLVAALQRPHPTQASLRTWLERIARNLAAGRTRARSRRRRREQVAAQPEAEPSTADLITRFELHRSVSDAVQSLGEPTRTTLLLRFWEDLPPREIARRTNTPVETVRTRIKRGVLELRHALDRRHESRAAWCLPLLALPAGRSTSAAAAASATSAALGVLMQTKTLAISALAIFGLIGVYAWQHAASPPADSLPNPLSGTIATTDREHRGDPSRPPDPAGPERRSLQDRGPGSITAQSTTDTFSGSVLDAASLPLADVEVGFLTRAEADRFHSTDAPLLAARALNLKRVRRTLWHLSDRGWMTQDAVLGRVFETTTVTRTDAAGKFEFAPTATKDRSVLVVWSPMLGIRFHPIPLNAQSARIRCETWPRIRGRIESDVRTDKPVRVVVETFPNDMPRSDVVLMFKIPGGGGAYETPPIPPAPHAVRFRLENHVSFDQNIDLIRDTRVDARLRAQPQLSARLLDSAGHPWDARRLAARGWDAQDLQFRLLRQDLRTESDLAVETTPRSKLLFTAEQELLRGTAPDPQALVLSVWADRAWITSTRLPNHQVSAIELEIPEPRPATWLDVRVAVAQQVEQGPKVRLALGTMVGMGRYNFKSAVSLEDRGNRFRLRVPGFLRGQPCRLIATAEGFAERILDVFIPVDRAPTPISLTLAAAPHAVSVRIVDQDGKPLRGARLRITTAEGRAMRSRRRSIGRTDDRGEFRFEDLAAGPVRVFVSRRGFAHASALISTVRHDTTTIRLHPGRKRKIPIGLSANDLIMLRVLDAQGQPIIDDRAYGLVHGGSTVQLTLTSAAHSVEVWRPGGTQPIRTLRLE